MSTVSTLLTFLLNNNSGPSSDERELVVGTVYDPPCRGFYTEFNAEVGYVTASGQTIERRLIGGQYHPVKIRELLYIRHLPNPVTGVTEDFKVPTRMFGYW